jgi:phosphatidylserine decarboxylase
MHRPNNNYWKLNNRANFDSLFKFFYIWSLFAPTIEDRLSAFIELFYEFHYNNEPAIRIVTQFPGYEWTKYFLDWRKKYMDSPRSLWTIDDWKKDPSWNDYIIPEGGFKSFNELFTRKIKSGLRPIDEPHDLSILVSPSDSRLNKVENKLSEYDCITTKVRQKLSIKQLLYSRASKSSF